MERTITVKGIGRVSAKPDRIEVLMELCSEHQDYATAMKMATESIERLNGALSGVGFEKGSVKTADFTVRTNYKNVQNGYGDYQRVFCGYAVCHSLKLVFDFDTKKLSQTLGAISDSLSNPQITIGFTVGDASAVNRALLCSAVKNAREKAEILCDASNVALGELIQIDYNWQELDIYSRTRLTEPRLQRIECASVEIDPEDIDVSDTATFVWKIH